MEKKAKIIDNKSLFSLPNPITSIRFKKLSNNAFSGIKNSMISHL